MACHTDSYLGWHQLIKSDNTPDDLWMNICEHFCQDESFKTAYINFTTCQPINWSPKDGILFFLNSLFSREVADIPVNMWHDKDFVLLYIQHNGDKYQDHILNQRTYDELDPYVSLKIKSEQEYILYSIKYSLSAFDYISESLKTNKNFMLSVIDRNAAAFPYVAESLKSDRSFVLACAKRHGLILKFSTFLSDYEIAKAAVIDDIAVWNFVDESLKVNRKFILELMKYQPNLFKYIDDKFVSDKEIVMAAAKRNSNTLYFMSH